MLLAVVMAHTQHLAANAQLPKTADVSTKVDARPDASRNGAEPLAEAQAEAHQRAFDVAATVQIHCGNCHAAAPTQAGFATAPGGLLIETPAQLVALKARALPAIQSHYMPLGNFAGLTEDERRQLITWLSEQ